MIKYSLINKSTEKKVSKHMTKMLTLKQFFTPQEYSNVLINNLEMQEPIKVIDLAMGECSLLLEAQKKWKFSYFFGNDIDIDCFNKTSELPIDIKCFNYNIFLYNAISSIQKYTGKVDLCIGNPPFDLMAQTRDTIKLLKSYSLNEYIKTKTIPAEIVYILQCLRILKKQGTLALILPDGFFVNKFISKFREFLIKNYFITKIIQLPKNIFKKTDAKTHIFILQNTKPKPKSKNIELFSLAGNSITISQKEAINRMDYSYYYNSQKHTEHQKLSDLNIKFIRGKSKYKIKEFKDSHILHTTNFRKTNLFKSKLKTKNQLLKYPDKIAQPGDIILSRVGTNCLGKIGMVESGYFLITDCIFIIRVESKVLRHEIYQNLNSEDGQNWIKANSKGVAARHITLEDIKKFPIHFRKENYEK